MFYFFFIFFSFQYETSKNAEFVALCSLALVSVRRPSVSVFCAGAVLQVKIVSRGARCLSLACDGTLRLWSLLSGRQLRILDEFSTDTQLQIHVVGGMPLFCSSCGTKVCSSPKAHGFGSFYFPPYCLFFIWVLFAGNQTMYHEPIIWHDSYWAWRRLSICKSLSNNSVICVFFILCQTLECSDYIIYVLDVCFELISSLE